MGNVLKKIGRSAKRTVTAKFDRALIRKLSVLIIFFLALFIFLRWACFFYTTSSYFDVKKILLAGDRAPSSVDYNDIIRIAYGKNIFRIDLREISEYMLNRYSELKAIQIRIAFPDSLLVSAILRKPAAQIFKERYYPIDEKCIVLSDIRDFPDKNLPVITGIDANLSKSIGKKIESKSLNQALILFQFIKEFGILNNHTLREINAGDMKNISFILDEGIEVRIGCEDYRKRLENLKEVLDDPKIWPSDISYIDLRFGEPVIGPKWKK